MERRRGSGRPPKSEHYIPPNGKRVVAFRIPPEMKDEFIMRAKRKGVTLQAYLQFALHDFMQREAAKEAEWQARIEAAREGRQ